MYSELKDKVVIITGGSNGIGRAIVERFVKEGSIVYNFDVSDPKDPLGKFIRCDASSENDVKNSINRVIRESGRVNVLINNAGIESFGSVGKVPLDEWKHILDVNLQGAFLMSKFTIPHMQENGGVIEFISSIQAKIIQKKLAAYVTSKHALIGLMKSIAIDYAPKIRSMAICPGSVRTPLLEWTAMKEVGNNKERIEGKLKEWGNLYPMKRIAEAHEVANLVAFLASDEAMYITGLCIPFDGGLSIALFESVPEDDD